MHETAYHNRFTWPYVAIRFRLRNNEQLNNAYGKLDRFARIRISVGICPGLQSTREFGYRNYLSMLPHFPLYPKVIGVVSSTTNTSVTLVQNYHII